MPHATTGRLAALRAWYTTRIKQYQAACKEQWRLQCAVMDAQEAVRNARAAIDAAHAACLAEQHRLDAIAVAPADASADGGQPCPPSEPVL